MSFGGKDAERKAENDAGRGVCSTEGNYEGGEEATPEGTGGRQAGKKRGGAVGQQGARKTHRGQMPVQTRPRTTQRRPFELFEDQLLWIGRTKVEVLEQYGRRLTANAMVQLAVDLLIEDYRQAGRRSHLVNDLVRSRPPAGRATSEGSFDLFDDQLLWLARTKVDLMAAYGQRVSGNAMVQLALDLLIQDYHEKGRGSALVTKLVFSEATAQPEEEGEEASGGGARSPSFEGG